MTRKIFIRLLIFSLVFGGFVPSVFASNNPNLSSLSTSEGGFNETFDSDTMNYTVTVDYFVQDITLYTTTVNSSASIGIVATSGTVNEHSVNVHSVKGIDVGDTTITITVTSEDTLQTKDYVITVTREDIVYSDNANLSALTVSEGTLSPVFDKDIEPFSVFWTQFRERSLGFYKILSSNS